MDHLGCRERSDALPDLQDEILAEGVGNVVAVLDGNEGVDGLAGELVGDTNDGGLGDGVMLDQSSFDLCGRESVPRDVDDVVYASTDPVVTFVVSSSSVPGELSSSQLCVDPFLTKDTYVVTLVNVQVGVHVSLVSTPDGSCHGRPCLLECQDTLDVVAVNLLARDRIDDGRLDTEERQRSTSRLGRSDSSKRRDDVGARLGLPVSL